MSIPGKGKSIQKLDAVILIAHDFEGQCRFYEKILGLEKISDYGDAAFFRVDDQVIGIFAKSHHPEGTRRLGGGSHGISHLEFRVAAEDIDTLKSKLSAAGAYAYGENFADADGNLFHFNVSERPR
jgi:catechol 2,3-dioxygenase-like lactoylglutathione lyase family enzyme